MRLSVVYLRILLLYSTILVIYNHLLTINAASHFLKDEPR